MLRANLQRDQMESASRWSAAMREAGVPDETIDMVLETALADRDARQADFLDQVGDTMYVGELPEGLITIDDAANKFDLNRNTVCSWIWRGLLQPKGRLRASARRGGKIVLDETEFQEFLNTPRKTGRPPQKRNTY